MGTVTRETGAPDFPGKNWKCLLSVWWQKGLVLVRVAAGPSWSLLLSCGCSCPIAQIILLQLASLSCRLKHISHPTFYVHCCEIQHVWHSPLYFNILFIRMCSMYLIQINTLWGKNLCGCYSFPEAFSSLWFAYWKNVFHFFLLFACMQRLLPS